MLRYNSTTKVIAFSSLYEDFLNPILHEQQKHVYLWSMEWEDYLSAKKIDPHAFKQGDPALFAEFARLFMQMHPDSFTAQKLFLINQIRRNYPAQAESVAEPPKASPSLRPKMKPKT